MDQNLYRAVNHYRQAWSKETGAAVWVDDVTFNADMHSDVDPSAKPSDAVEKSSDEAAKTE